jgi:hypothetical protein
MYCEISSFGHGAVEALALLGCYAAYVGSLPTFRNSLSVPWTTNAASHPNRTRASACSCANARCIYVAAATGDFTKPATSLFFITRKNTTSTEPSCFPREPQPCIIWGRFITWRQSRFRTTTCYYWLYEIKKCYVRDELQRNNLHTKFRKNRFKNLNGRGGTLASTQNMVIQ